jgi:endoglucanase
VRSRMPHLIKRFRVVATLIAVAGLGSAGAVAVSSAATSAGCAVTYTVPTQWNVGFTASVMVTNTGTPLSNWTLKYSFPGSQQLTQGWSGNWTQTGDAVTVTNASWNGSLATGGSTQIGANFSYSGTNPSPVSFLVNGTTCGAGPAPSPSASTPTSAPPATTPTPTPTATPAPSPTPKPTPAPTTPAPTPTATPPAPPAPGSAPQLQVAGSKLVNASGQQVVLHGVDRSGTEFACVQGWGIFDGPSDQASITAMKSVGVNAVRVPLNEACWNGEPYVNSAFSGATYQSAIKAYVSLLNSSGIVAILDLHWTDGAYSGNGAGCSSAQATCQKPMPDSAQSVPFWSSVASTFKGNDAVVFDLFNEPFPEQADSNNETEGWQCWLSGGACTGISYPVAGMQTLVSAVRQAGANNVIMLGGLEWSNDLTQWLAHEPTDPDHDLAASWHSYNFNACSTQSCWTSQVAPVIAKVPVITGEIGENDCADGYISSLMTWLDSEHTSYLAWTWNTDFNCASGPGLISNYDGTPTAFGAGFESHLETLAKG